MSKKVSAVKEKAPPVQIEPRYVIRLAGTLLGICTAVALLLGLVNSVTEPIISQMQREKTEAAMRQVLSAGEYEEIDFATESVLAVYRAIDGDAQKGFVVEVKVSGFGGGMNLVVGVDMNGAVTGVAVTKHSETKGIGTNVVDEPAVLERFIGLSGTIVRGTGNNEFDGVSGATISSEAVIKAVNAALEAVAAVRN